MNPPDRMLSRAMRSVTPMLVFGIAMACSSTSAIGIGPVMAPTGEPTTVVAPAEPPTGCN